MNNQDLAQLSHSQLWLMRDRALDQKLQDLLAAYEHRAFAREAVAERPYMALPIGVATPLYQGAKLLGLTGSRSRPSFEQMRQGLLGVGEGLLSNIK